MTTPTRTYDFFGPNPHVRNTTPPPEPLVVWEPEKKRVPRARLVKPVAEWKNRPGPRIESGRTPAMYWDYCTGLTVAEVAVKWDVSGQSIYRRFQVAGLPLRDVYLPGCLCRARSSKQVQKVADRRDGWSKTRARSVENARAALSGKWSDYSRSILQLRIDNPDVSVIDLASLADPPLTAHQIVGVLRRAAKVAADLEEMK